METKINLFLICIFLLLLSCHSTKTDVNTTPIQNQWNVGMKDTVLKQQVGNTFLAYQLQGDSLYSVKWGNASIKNTSKQKFEILGNGVLGVLKSNEDVILLSQGCGTSCTDYVFLPIIENSIEKVYNFALTSDLEQNLVAYIPDNSDDRIFVRVENYLTGQKMDVMEDDTCIAVFKADCIDSIYFNKSSLVLKWQGSKWSNSKQDFHKKIIPVNFE